MNNQPKVFVIVLNWNGRQLLDDCIRSLSGISYHNYSVVVVDNGSSDGSPEMVKDKYPGIKIIKNEINLGYCKANNIGMEYAMAQGADYILLLNNDVEVSADFLERLVEVAERDKKIGIVGPKIYFYDRPSVIWFAGGILDLRTGSGGHIGYNQIDRGQYDEVKEVDYITGCAIMIRRAVIERIGYLDEDYYLYSDDTDFSYRTKAAGFNIYFVPFSHIWHKASSTNVVDSPLMNYYLIRNSFIFSRKHLKGKKYYLFLFYYHLKLIKYLVKNLLQLKSIKAVLLAYFDFIKGIRGESPYYQNIMRGKL